jgi:hypothetical protein
MTQTQQKSLISIIFIALIAGLIVSLNVDDQDTQSRSNPAIRLSILAIMPSASAMSASVCLISSLSSGGSGLGKPGGKRGSKTIVSYTHVCYINFMFFTQH